MGGLKFPIVKELLPLIVLGVLSMFIYSIGNEFVVLILSATVTYALYRIKLNKKPELDLRRFIRSAITGSFSGYATLLFAILFVIYTSWMADDLRKREYS